MDRPLRVHQRPIEQRWQHDCSHCTYLGSFGQYDVYAGGCRSDCNAGLPTLLARWGNAGHEYGSGAGFVTSGEHFAAGLNPDSAPNAIAAVCARWTLDQLKENRFAVGTRVRLALFGRIQARTSANPAYGRVTSAPRTQGEITVVDVRLDGDSFDRIVNIAYLEVLP